MSDATPDPSPPPGELFNTPVEFEYKGTRYKSRQLTNDEIGEFCSWLEQQALEKAWLRSSNLPAEAREAIVGTVTGKIAGGAYRVGGPVFLDVTWDNPTVEAGAYQLYLTLRNEHPDLTLDDCVEMHYARSVERARENIRRGLHLGNSSGGRGASSGPSKVSSRSSRKKGSGRTKRKR